MSHKLLGEIVEKDGWICLQNVRGNAWFPLEGNSGIAADFQETFNTPHPSDTGRRLYYVGGVMQMKNLEQAAERRAREGNKMSAAIHTRFGSGARGRYIRAWTKDGKGAMALRVPYAHELHHSKRHPAAAKALAEKLGWSGLWVVGHNEDNSICAVRATGPAGRTMLEAQQRRYATNHGSEGEDWFFVPEKTSIGEPTKVIEPVERCPGCGITVFTSSDDTTAHCTACEQKLGLKR